MRLCYCPQCKAKHEASQRLCPDCGYEDPPAPERRRTWVLAGALGTTLALSAGLGMLASQSTGAPGAIWSDVQRATRAGAGGHHVMAWLRGKSTACRTAEDFRTHSGCIVVAETTLVEVVQSATDELPVNHVVLTSNTGERTDLWVASWATFDDLGSLPAMRW